MLDPCIPIHKENALWKFNEPINRSTNGLYLKHHSFVDSINHGKTNLLTIYRYVLSIVHFIRKHFSFLSHFLLFISLPFSFSRYSIVYTLFKDLRLHSIRVRALHTFFFRFSHFINMIFVRKAPNWNLLGVSFRYCILIKI